MLVLGKFHAHQTHYRLTSSYFRYDKHRISEGLSTSRSVDDAVSHGSQGTGAVTHKTEAPPR